LEGTVAAIAEFSFYGFGTRLIARPLNLCFCAFWWVAMQNVPIHQRFSARFS
jgi:hypothetical protein